jgi:SAM-dependent methyltransferase
MSGSKLSYRTTCRLCGRNPLERVVKFDPIALPMKFELTKEAAQRAELFPINLYMCSDCGHVQQLEVVDDEALWVGYTYQSAHAPVMPQHFKDVAAKVMAKYKPEPGSLVIDIGSNDGSFLRPFKEAGYRVLGIEMVKEIAKQATENGIETIGEPLSPKIAEEVRRKYGGAAIVTAFNVLAHSDDLHSMAKAIQGLLDPKGVFVFEVQYLMDVIEKTLVATIFHEHLSHHSVKSMQQFLSAYYMNIIDVDRVPIQHGSIIGYVQFANGPRMRNPYVDYLIEREKKMGLDKPATLLKFAEDIYKLRADCESLVATWKSEGATVAGYGAAMSGPGLISMLGLKDTIEYILDDHQQKVGKFSPGDGIPVVPTAELLARQPDYCVILAWVHSQRIIDQNSEYLARGGKFVVLCPDFRVVEGQRQVEAAHA